MRKTFFLFLTFGVLFLSCEKENTSNDDVNDNSNPGVITPTPTLLNLELGLNYSDVLENLKANGYFPSEQTDSTIIFKGENLSGIHPFADFLTDYIIDSSKEITFIFEDNELHSLQMEGEPDTVKLAQQKRSSFLDCYDYFYTAIELFAVNYYEDIAKTGVNYDGFPYGRIFRDNGNKVIGEWDMFRLSWRYFNIYPTTWRVEVKDVELKGIVIWFLFTPEKRPSAPADDNVVDFETNNQDYINKIVDDIVGVLTKK